MKIQKPILAVAAVATTAVLFASGGAVAGSLITSADIKDNTVKSIDLKDGKAVGEADLKPQLAAKVNATSQPGTQGPAGPQGPQGPRGPQGQDGADGADGASAGISAAGSSYDTTWAAGEFSETVETCAAGEYVTGGGYSTFGGAGLSPTKDLGGDNANIQVTVSAPYIASDGAYVPISDTNSRFYADRWVVRGYNNGDTDQIVRAWALCAPIPAN